MINSAFSNGNPLVLCLYKPNHSLSVNVTTKITKSLLRTWLSRQIFLGKVNPCTLSDMSGTVNLLIISGMLQCPLIIELIDLKQCQNKARRKMANGTLISAAIQNSEKPLVDCLTESFIP